MLRDSGKGLYRLARHSQMGCWAALFLCLGSFSTLSNAYAQDATVPTRSTSAAPAVAPQPSELLSAPVPLAVALETRGDLTLQSATIEKALFTIGASWRVNIVVGKDVKGNVSCIYKQAPLREVLDAILLANGYSYRAVGESLVVQLAQDVGSANPLFESAAISITHSEMQEVMEGARLLLSKQGKIHALNSAKSILVVDYADRVASIRDFIARMDAAAARETGGIPAESYQRLQVSYFHTQYISVEDVREPLTAVLSQAGRVATMPKENRLVVIDYASNIAMVRRVLDKIDRPTPQVRITALIYDISLQDVEELGFNWSSVGSGNNLDAAGNAQQLIGLGTQTVPFSGTASTADALRVGTTPIITGPVDGIFAIQSLTRNFNISAVAQFLQTAKDARLLANPSVTVMDNETADMSSIQEIPYQQLTSSTQGDQAVATTAFKEVGIKLNVTPTVAADGTIKLIVDQEFNRVAGVSGSGDVPIIDTRRASTTVRVANRKTLVIGGLRQRSDTGDFNGIPFLKDVKYIGPLFRSKNTTVRESELIVFLMPEIVSYQQQLSQREYLARQTINCRLDRVPLAEGCEEPSANGDCSTPLEGEIIYDGPTADRANEPLPQFNPPAAQNTTPPTDQFKTTPLRPGFGDRYQAAGGAEPNRRFIQVSTAPGQPTVKDDSRALMRLLRSKR